MIDKGYETYKMAAIIGHKKFAFILILNMNVVAPIGYKKKIR